MTGQAKTVPSVEAALAYAEGFQAALKQVENAKVAQLIEMVNGLNARLAFERAQVAALEGRIAQLRAALGSIASCTSYHEGDVVDIARKALMGD